MANQERGRSFTIKEAPVENLRPIRVRVIGAGFSGILAAIRIPEKIRNVDLVVYEKNEGIGGVWWLNRYPGIACDVPSHSYQYTFAPNPHWSNLYAPGQEIREYLENVAERFGATRFIKTSHQVTECVWDEDRMKWKLKVLRVQTGEVIEDEADVLVSARGQLNEVLWPDIPGLRKFKGKVVHSAEWDGSYDFRHKKIGIIGNGSSGIQLIPPLQRLEGASLTVFARSKTWISPSFGARVMATELGVEPGVTEFSERIRHLFSTDAAAWFGFRKAIEDDGNLIHDSMLKGTEMQRDFRTLFAGLMRQRLAKKPELYERVAAEAEFPPGCRRLTPGPGFLEALTEDNVQLVTDSIARITDDGIVVADDPASTATVTEPGDVAVAAVETSPAEEKVHRLDVIVCATGFRTACAPTSFVMTGKRGMTLEERWADRPESYLSVAVDGFPNYLMLFGPNSAIGFGSLTRILEAECDYVVSVIRKLQKEDYATFEARPERVRDFVEFSDVYFARTVHLDGGCKSWYRSGGGKGDKIVSLWPGSTLHALEALRSPRWEDFVWESRHDGDCVGDSATGGGKNMLRWLGNGWSVTQTGGDPSWYINPEEVDWPMEGRPEDAKKYQDRPWSY